MFLFKLLNIFLTVFVCVCVCMWFKCLYVFDSIHAHIHVETTLRTLGILLCHSSLIFWGKVSLGLEVGWWWVSHWDPCVPFLPTSSAELHVCMWSCLSFYVVFGDLISSLHVLIILWAIHFSSPKTDKTWDMGSSSSFTEWEVLCFLQSQLLWLGHFRAMQPFSFLSERARLPWRFLA